MSGIQAFKTALMPLSQAASWYMVTNQPLYSSVSKISSFYCTWALYNKYLAGQTQELGHISMGLLATASYLENRGFSIAATGLVIANFLLPAYYILTWSPKELATKVKKSDSTQAIFWAYVFKLYFVSNLGLWSTVLFKLLYNKLNYDTVPSEE